MKNPFYRRLRRRSNPRRCITQDSEPNTLPTESRLLVHLFINPLAVGFFAKKRKGRQETKVRKVRGRGNRRTWPDYFVYDDNQSYIIYWITRNDRFIKDMNLWSAQDKPLPSHPPYPNSKHVVVVQEMHISWLADNTHNPPVAN